MLPQSASSAFLLVQVLVIALLHRLLQEVHGFGFGFCGGWGGEGLGYCRGCGWVLGDLVAAMGAVGVKAAGAAKELVVVVLWRLGAGAARFW